MQLKERAQRIQCGLASPADLEGLSRQDLLAIKGDQSEMHFRFIGGQHAVDTVKSVGDETKTRYRHVASDESVDSVGDIIRVKGWKTDRFEKNPVLLWAHDQRSLPVGVVDKTWKGRAGGQKALLTESSFHPAELNPQGELVRGLVEAGALPGVSVGFIPMEMIFPKDETERKSLGLGMFGVLHVKQELLELSVVPVPANGNALRQKCIERAAPIFEMETWDRALVEHVERALGFTVDDESAIRRRMIVVSEDAHALVKDTAEEPAPVVPPAAGHNIEVTPLVTSQPQVHTLNYTTDSPSTASIQELTRSVDLLRETLTKESTVAASVPEGTEDPQEPVGPGEDFVSDVLKGVEDISFS